ncbi:MAG TPA: hypothetical protein DHV26_00960 [Cytophagales bacterium]|nr:hypothetical protein [Cytophagales bacterium]
MSDDSIKSCKSLPGLPGIGHERESTAEHGFQWFKQGVVHGKMKIIQFRPVIIPKLPLFLLPVLRKMVR